MNLELSNREVRNLVRLLLISDWVLHAHEGDEPRDDTADFQVLIGRIFSLAKAAGCENLINAKPGPDGDGGAYEREVLPFIDAFAIDTMWDELAATLAERDAVDEVGESEFDALEAEAKSELLEKHERRWMEEFGTHGLQRLKVD